MENAFIRSILSPDRAGFWFFIGAVFALLTVGSLILGFSPLIAPGAALALSSLALIRKPHLLLALLLTVRMTLDYLSETIRITINQNFSLSLSQVVGIFLISLSMILFLAYREQLFSFSLLAPFSLLILFGIASSFFSIAPATSLQEIARLISIFSIAFLAYVSVRSAEDMKRVILILLFSSILPLIETVRQVILGIGLSDTAVEIPRIYGTFAHPNVLALYLFSLFVIAVLFLSFPQKKPLTQSEKHNQALLLGAYLLLVSFLLLLTYTRVAWIALFLFVFVLAISRSRILLIPLILFPILLFIFSPSFQERVVESFETRPDSSIVWRQEIWHDVTTKLRLDDGQLFGTGLDTFTLYAENLRGTSLGSTDSHNDFVKFYIEGGVVGLLVFFAYLGLLARQIRRLFSLPPQYRSLVLIFSLYAGLLLLSSLSDNVYKDTPLQWIFFILLGGLVGLYTKEKTGEEVTKP